MFILQRIIIWSITAASIAWMFAFLYKLMCFYQAINDYFHVFVRKFECRIQYLWNLITLKSVQISQIYFGKEAKTTWNVAIIQQTRKGMNFMNNGSWKEKNSLKEAKTVLFVCLFTRSLYNISLTSMQRYATLYNCLSIYSDFNATRQLSHIEAVPYKLSCYCWVYIYIYIW